MSIRARVLSTTLAILVMVPAASAAQTPLTFGIKGGVNSSSVKDEGNTNIGRLMGIVGGVFVGGNINDKIGLQVEGLYSQRGAKDESETPEFKLRTNYMDVPVLLSIGGGSASNTSFHLFTGPQVSFLLSAKASAEGVEIDIKDELESMDFGWTLGAGATMNKITLDARYTHGLKNMAKSALSEDSEIKNRTFAVMIGIRLK